MHRWSPLNDRQRELLRRLDGGEKPGVASAERLSAYALRGRGLLVVVRSGGAVRTEVAEAGKFYLEHGHHPEDPRHAAALQETDKKTPVPHAEWPGARVRHARAAADGPAKAPTIPVPAQLRTLHPVVAALKEDPFRPAVPAAVRSRALRLLQALCAEAVKRGHAVREHPVAEHYRSRPYSSRGASIPSRNSRREGELDLGVGGFTYTVTIKQLEWARAYVRSLDPLRALPGMPVTRDPESEELKPYLSGWNPRGPETHDYSWRN
ncbi:hypothetical protein ACODT5_12965 [Streptomyces sp. 5.8]|uniref:hypothetical protein n=1 Tax=Streptomyces sp. 5.8 TaxID=3406571 RepID=UPI003BB5D0EC